MPASPARKRVFVPVYTQSGQLAKITEQILAPLRASCDVVEVPVRLKQPYPYPWPFFRFLDAFPESIAQIAPQIEPLAIAPDAEFDLVILPYQIWYLAPSLPIQAVLADTQFQRLVRNKPVITVIACRNMWHLAHEKMKARLATLQARLLDNVVLTDQGGTLATFITTPRWLWTGKTDAFWGLPPAGVHPDEIRRASRFGRALCTALAEDLERGTGPLLAGLEAVKAAPNLLVSEKAGTRSFTVWGKLLRAVGKPGAPQRVPVLFAYVVFLIALIITIVPISLTLQWLLRPLLKHKLAQAGCYFEQPSGSGAERMKDYE